MTTGKPTRHSRSYLVTGASSGIGLEIVRLLHERGDKVIATGRRIPSQLPKGFPDIPYYAADLSDFAARSALLEATPDHLDRAILCAGRGHYRPLTAELGADISEVVEVNLAASIHLAHGLYHPLMASAGRIAFVGSVASKGAASMPVYAATKAAVDGFARSLALEWQGRIAVKALHPGPTATGMSVRSGRAPDFLDRLMLPPAVVARTIVAALEDNGPYRRTISYGRVLTDNLLRRSG